jgi:hypothetical protein
MKDEDYSEYRNTVDERRGPSAGSWVMMTLGALAVITAIVYAVCGNIRI